VWPAKEQTTHVDEMTTTTTTTTRATRSLIQYRVARRTRVDAPAAAERAREWSDKSARDDGRRAARRVRLTPP